MKRKRIMIVAVIALAMVVGYNLYSSQKSINLSDLAIVNMEALAQNESSGNNCEPSSSKECCVCNGIHYTYQSSVNRDCTTKSDCNHWN